jgi:hypothetical protein
MDRDLCGQSEASDLNGVLPTMLAIAGRVDSITVLIYGPSVISIVRRFLCQ